MIEHTIIKLLLNTKLVRNICKLAAAPTSAPIAW